VGSLSLLSSSFSHYTLFFPFRASGAASARASGRGISGIFEAVFYPDFSIKLNFFADKHKKEPVPFENRFLI
jgi:hypothetical protein